MFLFSVPLFVCNLGDEHFTQMGGEFFSNTGVRNIWCTREGGGQIFLHCGEEALFVVGGPGVDDDIKGEEEDEDRKS